MKIFLEEHNSAFSRLVLSMGHSVTDNILKARAVFLAGGSDVNPAYYRAKVHPLSQVDFVRDNHTIDVVEKARLFNVPVVGVCRGGQFLNVWEGGYLIQHVEGHALGEIGHPVHLSDGRVLQLNSYHHQMMMPADHAELLAWSLQVAKRKEIDSPHNTEDSTIDPEVIWYREAQYLCFQPHPEYNLSSTTYKYFWELVEQYINV